ncbi:hypothetical protein ACVWWR_000959 [Bradyrhizobium sp. LM3.2]
MHADHADHDGPALAVADSLQSVTRAECVDASNDLEINLCKTQLRLLVAAGFAVTLLSAGLALAWWGGMSDYDTAMGYAGVALFGTDHLLADLGAPRRTGAGGDRHPLRHPRSPHRQ